MGWELVLALALSLRLKEAREPQAHFNVTPGIHEFVTVHHCVTLRVTVISN